MAHFAQRQFFNRVKEQFPDFFRNKKVIDCGSLDVNGSLRDLFEGGEYAGVDIHSGKNVDVVMPVHKLPFKNEIDTVVSAEMLEHDEFWWESLRKMYEMLRSGGLLAISAAGEGRPEHGTTRMNHPVWGTSHDYYRNIQEEDFAAVFDLDSEFAGCGIEYNPADKDIYFYGIKA